MEINTVPGMIYESFTADYTSAINYALNKDGRWFTRIQRDTYFGSTWTPWRAIDYKPSGWLRATERKARLPKMV